MCQFVTNGLYKQTESDENSIHSEDTISISNLSEESQEDRTFTPTTTATHTTTITPTQLQWKEHVDKYIVEHCRKHPGLCLNQEHKDEMVKQFCSKYSNYYNT